jgi:hypothetical protein
LTVKIAGCEIPDEDVNRYLEGFDEDGRKRILESAAARALAERVAEEERKMRAFAEDEVKRIREAEETATRRLAEEEVQKQKERDRKNRPLYV